MRKFMKYATVPMSIAALSACADQSAGPTGPQGSIELNVAPLNLPGITNASYDLWVTGNSGDQIWREDGITADQYGDGSGAVTYIGTCDAQDGTHTVHLKMNTLTDASTPDLFAAGEAVNPCPVDCSLTAPCVENSDTAVTYNLAIMRDADQGFFDIAVNFEDVFCSAKVDCQAELLHNGAGVRSPTAVIGFACTTGSTTTNLYVKYASDSVPGGIDESIDGNSSAGYAIYKDKEDIGGTNFVKGFWNAAILLNSSGNTVISGRATASQNALPTGGAQKFNSYPVITFNVPVPASCSGWTGPKQLDVAGSGVATQYFADPAAEFGAGSSSDLVDGSF